MNKQELARRIVRDMGYDYQTVRNIIDGIAFEGWLHDPDQVPGLTITWSELISHEDGMGMKTRDCLGRMLDHLGITVIPDPKPTPRQRLEALIFEKWGDADDAQMITMSILDEFDVSVKAPGGEGDE